jgi:hypothetical protein
MTEKRNPESSNGEGSFVRFFTSRSGRVFDARDYGYKAWPIRRRKRRK